MQRVTSMLPSWDKTKTNSKKGFDKAYAVVDKLGAPINRFSNKIGSEAFWPTTLDKESDKAARILKSFCKDGFYAEEDRPATEDVPNGKQRVLKKIPEKVIQNAVGLAIFTTMRTGLWVSGAGGSGVLIARKEDGEWSPPSGIMLHTAGLGFLVGVDIYDCVLVINNRKALDAFTNIRATLGGEISAVAGPAGIGGVLENDGKWKQANRPVFTYLKSRGFYAGVQVDGTVIIERTDENERFYGERIGVADILAGKARHPPSDIKMLMETVKAAEGRTDVDGALMLALDDQPAPADLEIEESGNSSPIFGVPEPDDPDPFGVLALEKIGLEIREAGTKTRPASTQFEFHPQPSSPVYSQFFHRSLDSRSNRESFMSTHSSRTRTSTERNYSTVGTQTDATPSTSPTRSPSRITEEQEKQSPLPIEVEEVDYTKVDMGPYNKLTRKNSSEEFDGTTINESPRGRDRSSSIDTSFNTEDEDDEPVVFEAASAQATVITPQAINARGGLVDIPKRPPPPPLPPRSVARTSKLMVDQASGRSPMREGFEKVDLHGVEVSQPDSQTTTTISSQPTKPELSHTHTADSRTEDEIKRDDEYCENNTFERKLDDELKEQHLNDITPMTGFASPSPVVLRENSKEKELELGGEKKDETLLGGDGLREKERENVDEKDEFHSLPTTPGEIQVK